MRHVLVPLDGSHLAEAALPAAAATAHAFAARVTLFHVIEDWAPQQVHGQPHLTTADQAQAYLTDVAGRPIWQGLALECHVHRTETGDVADSIMAHADELQADLVVLSAHGHGGLKGVVFGTIPQRALTRGRTPLLLVNPTPEGDAPAFHCRRILVPLDGSASHEPVLAPAARLAGSMGAELHLVVVVPTAHTLSGYTAAAGARMPMATRAILDLAEQDAESYIRSVRDRMGGEGLKAHWSVGRGEPLTVLIQTARACDADLVAMATHARGAMAGFWSGSLTPKLMQRLDRPMLLVRAEGNDPTR